MSKNKFYGVLLFIAVFKILILSPAVAQNLSGAYAIKEFDRIRLEEQLEVRLSKRISALLQDKTVFVVVKVRLKGEVISVGIEEKMEEEKGKEWLLPGVPVETKLSEKGEEGSVRTEKTLMRQQISNIHAWVYTSKEISEEMLEKAQLLCTEILSLDTARGDTLTIETIIREIPMWWENIEFGSMVKLFIPIMIFVAVIIFLFGTLRGFLQNFNSNISAFRIQAGAGAINRPLPGVEGGGGTTIRGNPVESKERSLTDIVNLSNIDDISYILSNDPAKESVFVLNSLPLSLASKIFSKLPTGKQRQIISELKETKFMDPDEVKVVQKEVENKVKYIYGGEKRASRLIQGCAPSIRESIMEWLKESDESFAGKIEANLIEFTDLLNYDDEGFRRIFREAGLQSFAQVLSAFEEDLISQFLAKLNPDIAELLKDQINIMPSNKRRSEEEQFRIIDIMSRLLEDGVLEPLKKEEE